MPELDALRGIAALVIMFFHLRFMGRHPAWGSGLDIDVFFVLSGYLITSSILHNAEARNFFRVFYFRRAIRIWPVYFLVMGLCVLINPFLPRPDALGDSASFLTFTQHVAALWTNRPSYFSRFFQHTWTLSIEEQFYLVWPLLVIALGRRRMVALVPLLVAVPVAFRWNGFFPNMILTRSDSLLLGSLLALLLDDAERLRRRGGAFRVMFGLIALATFSVPLWRELVLGPARRAWPAAHWIDIQLSVETLRVALADFALVGFVVCSTGRPWVGFLRDGRLRYVGRISFSLYMYHPIVFGVVTLAHLRLGLRPSVWMDAVKAASCIGVAALSWRFIERPIQELKDRLPYTTEVAGAARGPAAPPAPHGMPAEGDVAGWPGQSLRAPYPGT
jgi:peptidoglycan/LPS O-acetylase OafA/YrhL